MTFKLLDLYLDVNLPWSIHIITITVKASKRLYFLKQLKRAGVPPEQLLHFYIAVICPGLEYSCSASSVWHYAITCTQSQQPESIQKQATHIIFEFTRGLPCPHVLFAASLNSLEDRQDHHSSSFTIQDDVCPFHASCISTEACLMSWPIAHFQGGTS